MNLNLCMQTGGLTGHFAPRVWAKMIKDNGFSSVDFSIDSVFDKNVFKAHPGEGRTVYEQGVDALRELFKDQVEAIKAEGLYIYQAHAPFPAYMKDSPAYLENIIRVYKNTLLYCGEIGVQNLIIHGISLAWDDTTHTQEDIDGANEKLYTSLIETAKQTHVTICLENLFTNHDGTIYEGHCSDPHQAVQYIDHLNVLAGEEIFGICVDTGHLNLLGKNQYAYLTALGKRIKAFHIHDNDGKVDLHLAPYTGTIDWESFCRGVRDAGYDGDLSFETFRQYKPARVQDSRAVGPWVTLIAELGRLFVTKIREK